MNWNSLAPDVLALLGLGLLATGLAAYDWRLAAIVVGVLLLVMGVWSAVRGGR